LNVTATNSDADGFITVYACGIREMVSSVNFTAGGTVANAVIAPVSADGTFCFFSNVAVDVIADINGWFPAGRAFTPVGPKRVFDTRPGQSDQALRVIDKTAVPTGGMIEVQLTDLAEFVPALGVEAVSLNVTVVDPTAGGFVAVYACGTRGLVSSVNFETGQTVANAVIAPVSVDGKVCFYAMAATDLVVDINGWFQASSGFTGTSPVRVLDTRATESPDALISVPKAKIGGNDILEVKVTDLARIVPATGVGAVSLNVTATNPDGDGFITVYACGAREEVSSLNFTLGQTVANAVIAPVSAQGTICLFSPVRTDVIVDLNGWFANTPT
jgi:putative ubiquitin-RnfH superfamily antitoxin RatB of RatAB toxin-antitoxin module